MENLLGEFIRKSRKRLKINQSEFAKALDTTTNSISSIETGKHIPRPGTLIKIAKYLNVPVDQLKALAKGDREMTVDTLNKYLGDFTEIGGVVIPIDTKYKNEYESLIYSLLFREIVTARDLGKILSEVTSDMLSSQMRSKI